MNVALALELWIEALESEAKSKETIYNYRRFTRSLPELLPELEAPEGALSLRRGLADYAKSHAPDSVRTVYVAWHAFFGWCVREGLLTESPMRSMRSPKVPETTRDAYRPADVRTVLGQLAGQRTPIGLRNHALVAVLLDTGLRASELCRLTMDDVADGALLVRLSKSGRPRIAPLGRESEKLLGRYLRYGRPALKPQDRSLIVNQFGQSIDRHGLRQILGRVGAKVGVRLSAHRLRHTWASAHLRAGTPTETLRRLGGWGVGSQMVVRYAHLTDDDLKAAQLRASPLDRM